MMCERLIQDQGSWHGYVDYEKEEDYYSEMKDAVSSLRKGFITR